MRAALQNLAGNFDIGLTGVVAICLRAAARIFRDAAGLRSIGGVLGRIPVAGPLPDIADHVVDAVAVWRERGHRRGALKPRASLAGKLAVPSICHLAVAGNALVATREFGVLHAAPR